MDQRFAFVLVSALGCGGASTAGTTMPGPASEPIELDEVRITAHRTGTGYDFETYDAEGLFDEGSAALDAGDCDRASAAFGRVVEEFPTSRFVSAAYYNAGICLRTARRFSEAREWFAKLVTNLPESTDAKPASFLLTEMDVELERWQDVLNQADVLLARTDLVQDERLEAMTRKAQARFALGARDDAEREARAALTYYRTRPEDDPIRDEYFVAAANYTLAECFRSRAAEVTVPASGTAAQHDALERRAQFIVSAQTEYFNTIRYANASWSGAAGYRIGSMYDDLWTLIVRAPVPEPERALRGEVLEAYRDEYIKELARTVEPLLRHAVRYWELTLLMMERTGVQGTWADRTRADLDRVRARLVASSNGTLDWAAERSGQSGVVAAPVAPSQPETRTNAVVPATAPLTAP